MKLSTDTEVRHFNYGQQDALLAEMQAQLLRDFQAAATMADRASATAGFAQAAEASLALRPHVLKQRMEAEIREAQNPKTQPR